MGKEKPTIDTFDFSDCDDYSKAGLVALAEKLHIRKTGTKDELCERILDALLLRGKGEKDTKQELIKKETKKSKKEESTEAFDISRCMKYKQVELKEWCKVFGLAVKGNKTELCDRLKKYVKEKEKPKKERLEEKEKEREKPKEKEVEEEEISKEDKEMIMDFHDKKCGKDGKGISYLKDDLIEIAESLGIDPDKLTKKDLCEKIRKSLGKETKKETKKEEPKKKVKKEKKETKKETKKEEIEEEEMSKRDRDIIDQFRDKKCGKDGKGISYLKDDLIDVAESLGIDTTKLTKKELCEKIRKALKRKTEPIKQKKHERIEEKEQRRIEEKEHERIEEKHERMEQKQKVIETEQKGKPIIMGDCLLDGMSTKCPSGSVCVLPEKLCVSKEEAEKKGLFSQIVNGNIVMGTHDAIENVKKLVDEQTKKELVKRKEEEKRREMEEKRLRKIKEEKRKEKEQKLLEEEKRKEMEEEGEKDTLSLFFQFVTNYLMHDSLKERSSISEMCSTNLSKQYIRTFESFSDDEKKRFSKLLASFIDVDEEPTIKKVFDLFGEEEMREKEEKKLRKVKEEEKKKEMEEMEKEEKRLRKMKEEEKKKEMEEMKEEEKKKELMNKKEEEKKKEMEEMEKEEKRLRKMKEEEKEKKRMKELMEEKEKILKKQEQEKAFEKKKQEEALKKEKEQRKIVEEKEEKIVEEKEEEPDIIDILMEAKTKFEAEDVPTEIPVGETIKMIAEEMHKPKELIARCFGIEL